MKINASIWRMLSCFATTRYLGVDWNGVKHRHQRGGLMMIERFTMAS